LICRASNTSIALQNEENMVDRQKHDRPARRAQRSNPEQWQAWIASSLRFSQ
jgi:hypothetical protein